MSTRAIDPSTLKFAKTLVRIKARQLGRVIPDAAVNGQQDLEQEILLEVVIRWPGFDPNRGNAEAFVESVVRTKLCKMLRDAKRAKRMSGPTVSIDGNDAVDPDDGSRVLCIRMDVETVIGKLNAGKGTSIMVASQDPPSVPVSLIELSSVMILHKFNSPAWLKHLQKANAALGALSAERMAALRPGEAYVWASKATDEAFSNGVVRMRLRPRVTKHGGDTRTAT